MTIVKTDTRVDSAKKVRFFPTGGIVATNVQDAITSLSGGGSTAPPVISPTTVNFAASPYTAGASDYILEVDTSGGAVVINLPAVAGASGKPVQIKDVTGNAQANPIQINATIEGQTPYLIDSNFGVATIRPNKNKTQYEAMQW